MKGKCLCGKIAFTFEPFDGVALNCHCSICRRSHGADYATFIISRKSSLKFMSGEKELKEYSSSEFGVRAFCGHCGSRLMNYARSGSNYMSVALSAVEDDHGVIPSANVQVASKAPWVKPNGSVPSFAQFPEDINKYM